MTPQEMEEFLNPENDVDYDNPSSPVQEIDYGCKYCYNISYKTLLKELLENKIRATYIKAAFNPNNN